MSNLNQQQRLKLYLSGLMLSFLFWSVQAQAEWNADWASRTKVSVNAAAATEALNNVPVAVRLHSGNFDFTSVNIDGSDLRFIAADDKTELKHYVEKFDAVNELAIVWVQLPQLSAANKDAHFWIYSGNESAPSTSNLAAISDSNTVAKFQFTEKGLLQDSSPTKLVATGTVTLQKAGLIGESAVFAGTPLQIPANPAMTTASGYTWSAWVKPTTLPQTATIFGQGEALSLTIDAQALHLKVAGVDVTGGQLQPAVWQHIAFTLSADKATLYVNGAEVATASVAPPALVDGMKVGDAFVGEVDELEIAKTVRSAAWIKLIADGQGVDSKLLTLSSAEGEGGEAEGEGEANYMGILINSLTLDAKIVIAILGVMFAISAWVMWTKAVLVSKTDKDNKKFLARFQKSNAQDLLQLDKGANYPHSTLFGLYQAGLREIKKREKESGELSLSGASMDAIKAAIDADLVRETQRLNSAMVLLTIAISGGPFLGLLGTVVGVMITFAAIAAAGDVNVNAIAPGIAAALLATVAGLGVAIPALFGYNYLASRVKNITIAMQIFVDEFVTRTAELFGKE
jgi:biopolymer transport protein ExbB